MTLARERTVSEIHSFFHWAVMTRGHWEDRQWDAFILPLSCHDPRPLRGQWDIFILSPSYHDPGHRADRQWDTFILSLSYHDPGTREDRQWDTFISPLSYHNPGHREDRQWDTFILPLSCHDPGTLRGQTVRYLHSPTKLSWPEATERTDSEIYSFSHRAIMTLATERTDSEIHSFSHWAIMTRATGRTDSEIHSFFHWAIMTRGHWEDRQWDIFILPRSYSWYYVLLKESYRTPV